MLRELATQLLDRAAFLQLAKKIRLHEPIRCLLVGQTIDGMNFVAYLWFSRFVTVFARERHDVAEGAPFPLEKKN